MIRLILFFLTFVTFFCGCDEALQDTRRSPKKNAMQIPIKRRVIEQLSALSKERVNQWKDYENLNKFLQQFNNASPNEILDMSVELNKHIDALKDSLRITELRGNALNARYNVLKNEALRLKDMALIPAIQSVQVNEQIDKLLMVFNSYTQKVNTIYHKQKFDEEINLDAILKSDLK